MALALPVAARSESADLTVTPLADRLWLISGGGGNVTVFDSSDGVFMVDGGSARHAAGVVEMARKLSHTGRVHTLFNTHWHWDHTGSNATLGSAGVRIMAHENTRLWLTTDVSSEWERRVYERLPAHAQPNQTFYTSDALEVGGERIEYGHLPQAHTDGDIYVFFRDANVLVCGDAVSAGTWPIIDYCTGGWIGGMVEATSKLLELSNSQTKIVPGSGAVQSRGDVEALNALLATMKQRLSKLLAQGMSVQDMIAAAPAREFEAKWGDPKLFIANAWPGLVLRSRELGVSIV